MHFYQLCGAHSPMANMQMRLMPRPEGWGLHCSDLVYELCNVVGIRNLSVKLRGSRRNKLFVAQVGADVVAQVLGADG